MFLNLSVENMRIWCKDNFNIEEYVSVYGKEKTMDAERTLVDVGVEGKNKGNRGAISSDQGSLVALGSKVWVPVKVRVRCHGFREPISLTNRFLGSATKTGVKKSGAARVTPTAQIPILASDTPGVTRFSSPALTAVVSKAQRAQVAKAEVVAAVAPSPPRVQRKRKSPVLAAIATSSTAPVPDTSVSAPTVDPLSALAPSALYSDLSPRERLRCVATAVALRGRSLRANWAVARDVRVNAVRKMNVELLEDLSEVTMRGVGPPSVAKGDATGAATAHRSVHVPNTVSMWQFLSHSPYLADMTEEKVTEGLAEAWQPEMTGRELHWAGEIPTLRIRQWKRPREEIAERQVIGEAMTSVSPPSSLSLFNRLQSLLVEEVDTEDEDESGNDESSLLPSHKEESLCELKVDRNHDSVSFKKELSPRSVSDSHYIQHDKRPGDDDEGVMDVSALSLDQRAFLQLRAVGLIDAPLIPSLEPIVIEDCDDKSSCQNMSVNDQGQREQEEDSKVDDVIRRMTSHLSEMHRRNNTEAAFLQFAAMSCVEERNKKKLQDDKNAKLVDRHTQLVKRQSDKRKKMEVAANFARQNKREDKEIDNLPLPW